jgi:hypothetical protein
MTYAFLNKKCLLKEMKLQVFWYCLLVLLYLFLLLFLTTSFLLSLHLQETLCLSTRVQSEDKRMHWELVIGNLV